MVFEDGRRTARGSNFDSVRRFRETALAQELDLATHFHFGVIDENDPCLPAGAVCEMRDNTGRIHDKAEIYDWNDALDRIASFVRKEAKRRHKDWQRRVETYRPL